MAANRGPGRPRADTVAVLVRIPSAWQRRAERLVRHVRPDGGGSQADVYRRCIEEGLDRLEAAAAAARALRTKKRRKPAEPPTAEAAPKTS
jgi:hypothetical protein